MLRRILLTGSAAVVSVAPIAAYADSERKPFYDEQVPQIKNPLPGTILPPSAADSTAETTPTERLREDVANKTHGVMDTVLQNVQAGVHKLRTGINEVSSNVEEQTATLKSKFFEGERNVVKTIAELRAPGEEFLPNAIIILVAGLSGSIFSRRSNVAVRATLPVLFGVGAFAFFMPQTFQNSRALVWHQEKTYLPQLAEVHATADSKLDTVRQNAVEVTKKSESSLKGAVHKARQVVKSWTGVDLP